MQKTCVNRIGLGTYYDMAVGFREKAEKLVEKIKETANELHLQYGD